MKRCNVINSVVYAVQFVALCFNPHSCLLWMQPCCLLLLAWARWFLCVHLHVDNSDACDLWLWNVARGCDRAVLNTVGSACAVVCCLHRSFLKKCPAASVWPKWLLSRHYLGICSLARFCITFNYAFKERVNFFIAFCSNGCPTDPTDTGTIIVFLGQSMVLLF